MVNKPTLLSAGSNPATLILSLKLCSLGELVNPPDFESGAHSIPGSNPGRAAVKNTKNYFAHWGNW